QIVSEHMCANDDTSIIFVHKHTAPPVFITSVVHLSKAIILLKFIPNFSKHRYKITIA
ncbi:unnamed protein product, partial [Rotaria magnacalcarata]